MYLIKFLRRQTILIKFLHRQSLDQSILREIDQFQNIN